MLSANETNTADWSTRRRAAAQRALRGELSGARQDLCELCQDARTPAEQAAAISDVAAISAAAGRYRAAAAGWRRARKKDAGHCASARNLAVLESGSADSDDVQDSGAGVRVAILSLLFNWPSTGGGTVHTMELAAALSGRGYDVRHIYAVCSVWDVGRVTEPLAFPTVALKFDESEWQAEIIQDRFREAVDAFAPDFVIITDSWNTKPLLAEAVADYPCFLRLAALECLCPLNNVRLLFSDHSPVQCQLNQLADPDVCQNCVAQNSHLSGALHQAERRLGGFHDADYSLRLRRAFRGAEAVLVVNPEIAAMVVPYARRVEVIPSGFDSQRFPVPVPTPEMDDNKSRIRLIIAGLVDEPMKGFSVLADACGRLWSQRQDFELAVTSDKRPAWDLPFIRWIGWQSQAELPNVIRGSDVLIFPTIAQEALGRTAVEAMGCGKPVIASRLGGLPWVVEDGVTGLLVRPGDPNELAEKIGQLLDNPSQRQQLGAAGRMKFERDFLWEVILDRHYVPLLGQAVAVQHD